MAVAIATGRTFLAVFWTDNCDRCYSNPVQQRCAGHLWLETRNELHECQHRTTDCRRRSRYGNHLLRMLRGHHGKPSLFGHRKQVFLKLPEACTLPTLTAWHWHHISFQVGGFQVELQKWVTRCTKVRDYTRTLHQQ